MDKKFLKKLTAFVVSFVILVTSVLYDWPFLKIETKAASKYTLESRNAMYNGLAIEELGHSSTTPFRAFKMNTDNGVKKVFCGYSEGRGHEGDHYTKKVVKAKDWQDAGSSALFGKNVKSIAKAMIYYANSGDSSTFTKTLVQTYIWAKSMGRNTETALKQMASSLGVSYDKKVAPVVEAIKNTGIYGTVEIYTFTGTCVGDEGQNITHQPYYRWIAPVVHDDPEFDWLQRTATASIVKTTAVHVRKLDEKTGKPVPNTKIKISTKDENGKTITKEVITDEDGNTEWYIDRTYYANGTSDSKCFLTYPTWAELSADKKQQFSAAGIYENQFIAAQVAQTEAEQRAEAAAARIQVPSYDWTVEEISSEGHALSKANYKVEKRVDSNTTYIDIIFINPDITGSIKLNKTTTTDEYSSNYSVVGAKYGVYAAEDLQDGDGNEIKAGTEMGILTIPKSGTATLDKLPMGKYTVKELVAPEGFELDTKEYPIEIKDSTERNPFSTEIPPVNLTVEDPPKTGRVFFTKYIGDQNVYEAEPGVTFLLESFDKMANGEKYSVEKTTDENGYVCWEDVPYGNYKLTQVVEDESTLSAHPLVPKTFIIDDDCTEKTFPAGETTNYTPGDMELQLIKMITTPLTGGRDDIAEDDSFPTMIDVEKGAVFEIIAADGTIVDTITTDECGYAKSKKLEEGTYTLHQTQGMPGYDLMKDKPFTITQNETATIENDTFLTESDQRHGVYLELEKEMVPRDRHGKPKEAKPEEAEFYILDMSKITKAELEAANVNLMTEVERQAFITAHAGAVVGDKIKTGTNGKLKTYFPIDYDYPQEGFALVQVSGENGYKLSNIVYSTEDTVDKVMKGSLYSCTCKLEDWQYYYYGLAKVKKTKIIDGNGTEAPEVGAEFKLRIYDDDDPNKFTYFSYKDADGNKIDTFTTDANGEFLIPYLEQQDYVLEQSSGSPYHETITMDQNTINIVDQDCKVEESRMEYFVKNGMDLSLLNQEELDGMKSLTYNIVDQPKKAYIQVKKTSTFTGTLLNDTTFTIYKKVTDEGGNEKLEEVTKVKTGTAPENITDEEKKHYLGYLEYPLEYGEYVIRETDPTWGYLLTETDTGMDSSDPDFKLQEIAFTIDESHVTTDSDGNIVYRATRDDENGTILEFKDAPIMGRISVNKYGAVVTDYINNKFGFDTETRLLNGATFGLYAAEDICDDAGNVIHKKDDLIDTKVTNDQEPIYFTRTDTYSGEETNQFFMGNYYIKELKVPEGYYKDTTEYPITLSCDGTASKLNDMSEIIGDGEDVEELAMSHGNYVLTTGPRLNALIKDATKIVFTHVKAPTGVSTTDVSADQNGTVMMWKDGTTYYISSQKDDQVIYFNINCTEMFKNCKSLVEIVFNNIDTSYMAYATEMFCNCVELKTADLSNFDTGRLTNTVSMFQGSNLLETIYVGNNAQVSPDTAEPTIVGPYAAPKYGRYLYFDPNADGVTEEDKENYKLNAEKFNFMNLYSDGAADIIDVTDDDIASITPEYPYFSDGTTKSGALEVTIVLKGTSKYAINGQDTAISTFINVVDPADIDWTPIAEEHPESSLKTANNAKTIDATIRKVSTDNPDTTISGAVFSVRAATTLVDIDGNVIVEKGEEVLRLNSLDNDIGDGGDVAATELPVGIYAKDKNAKYLYEIVEVSAPAGYKKTDHVAYIPNIDLTAMPDKTELESLSSEYDDITCTFEPETVGSIDKYGSYNFTFTFEDEPCPMIRKIWDQVPVSDRPASLIIRAYADSAKTALIKTFTLTAENDWTAYWEDMPSDDITIYTFEEVIPSGVKWKQSGLKVYGPDSKYPNSVTFTNYINNPDINPSVVKVWDDYNDYDGIRPPSVTVSLYCNGEKIDKYSGIVLNDANNWTYTVPEKMPLFMENGEEYRYTWEEDPTPENLKFLTGDPQTGYKESAETVDGTTTITNTHTNKTQANLEKVWDDNDDHFRVRPETVTFNLYADGEKMTEFKVRTTNKAGKTKEEVITDGNVTISEEENWKAEAIELTKCKNGSTEIQYEWKEASPIKYYSSAYETTQEGLDTKYSYFKTVITNSCTVEYGKVHVEKRIDKKVYDAMTDKPSFSFTLYGTDMYGNGYRKTQKVSFDDPTHVTYVDGSDYVTVSTDFTDLEMGTYYLEETDADIFKWDYVTDISNGTVEEKQPDTPIPDDPQ